MSFLSGAYQAVGTRFFYGPGVAAPANRYTGRNVAGYSNPAMDVLLERLETTILSSDRTAVEADILRLALTDLPFLPMYFTVETATAAARVRNVPGPNLYIGNAWNLYEWDIVE